MARDEHYDQFIPLLAEYASTAVEDPRREQLHDQLVAGFLPLAHHVARRFAGRGQPLEDLEQVATIGLLGALRDSTPLEGGTSSRSRCPRSWARSDAISGTPPG